MTELSTIQGIQFFELKRNRYTGQYKRVSLKDIYTRKFLKQVEIENKIKAIKEKAQAIDQKLKVAPDSLTVFNDKVDRIKRQAELIDRKILKIA